MDEASIVCNCEANPVLLCKNNISGHSKLPRTHNFINISSDINQETRTSVIQLFSQIKFTIKSFKLKIINENSTLIKSLHKTTENILEKIKNYDQKLNEIILDICSLKVIDNSKPLSYIETLLSNTDSIINDIRSPNLHINEIDVKSITELFYIDPIDEYFYYHDHYPPTTRVIKFMQDKLSIFDPANLKINKIKYSWNKEFGFDGTECLLPNGSLFYTDNNSWLTISPIGKTKAIPEYKPSWTAGAVYVDGIIYLFGGDCNAAAKFIINENRWVSLTKSSIHIGWYATCALFKNKILIASNCGDPAYYDIITDSYSNAISFKLLLNTSKLFFVKNEKILLFEFSKFIYESNDNLMTWNTIGTCSIIRHYYVLNGYPTFYNGAVYIIANDYAYSFNLSTNRMEQLGNII